MGSDVVHSDVEYTISVVTEKESNCEKSRQEKIKICKYSYWIPYAVHVQQHGKLEAGQEPKIAGFRHDHQ